jgi:hypothetical protein
MRELRNLESDLDIFLAEPVMVARCPNQQFGVYDEDENHVGDIVADGQFFSSQEIREKVKSLFNRQA